MHISIKLTKLHVYIAGQAHFLKVEKICFQGKSEYQNMLVFQVIIIVKHNFWITWFLIHINL